MFYTPKLCYNMPPMAILADPLARGAGAISFAVIVPPVAVVMPPVALLPVAIVVPRVAIVVPTVAAHCRHRAASLGC